MKIHLAIPNFGPGSTAEATVAIALEAEAIGLDGVGATDHLLVPAGQPHRYERVFDPLVVLAYLAARTERVQLITSVIVVPMRNPIALAKQVATIDQLSGGRVLFGVGAGWHEQEFANVHADFGRRGRRLDEAIDLFRHLFSGSREPFRGEFYGYEDGVFEPLPVQREQLPILIGGNSDAALRRAARAGDVWESTALDVDAWTERSGVLRGLLGERPVELGARIGLPDDPGAMVEELERWKAAGAEHVMVSFGFAEGFLEKLRLFGREVLPRVRA